MGRTLMLRRVVALLLVCLCALLVSAEPAYAWSENHVTADDVRIEVDRDGQAVIEHRLTLKTNGSVRFREYVLRGVDDDAVPLDNSYAIPARDALSGSLESAVPLQLTLKPARITPDNTRPAEIHIKVSEGGGLRRGSYVLVLRYRTDLRSRGVKRDGGRVRIDWRGPLFDDGFDNGRVTFLLPAAPTPPMAVERPVEGDDATLAPTYLSEVRRGDQQDEVEIMRPFVPQNEVVPWAVRVDLRALLQPPGQVQPQTVFASEPTRAEPLVPRRLWAPLGAGLFVLYALLVWLKALEVRRRARDARAVVPHSLPLPLALRVPLAAAMLVAGLALQLMLDHASWGAVAVVSAAILAMHGQAALEPRAWMRAPGRWLSVSEREALGRPVRRPGAWLDAGSWRGKLLMLLLSTAIGVAVWWLSRRSFGHALVAGFDAVALLAIFGTGRASGLPPDPAVAPALFLRQLIKRLRKDKSVGPLLRLTPRLRIPRGEVDADELRLRVAPRLPLRGFGSIEIGLTYALGPESSVAMPEVLVRVVEGSPCDLALAAVSRRARITPGRKPDERVIALAPRLPTVRMTAGLVAALSARVVDREALKAAAPQTAEVAGKPAARGKPGAARPARRARGQRAA